VVQANERYLNSFSESFFELAGSFEEIFRKLKAFFVIFLYFLFSTFVDKNMSLADVIFQRSLGLSPEITFKTLEVVKADVDFSMLSQ
jgi:hypothetical protein